MNMRDDKRPPVISSDEEPDNLDHLGFSNSTSIVRLIGLLLTHGRYTDLIA